MSIKTVNKKKTTAYISKKTYGEYVIVNRLGKRLVISVYSGIVIMPVIKSPDIGNNTNGKKINQIHATIVINHSIFVKNTANAPKPKGIIKKTIFILIKESIILR